MPDSTQKGEMGVSADDAAGIGNLPEAGGEGIPGAGAQAEVPGMPREIWVMFLALSALAAGSWLRWRMIN